MSSSRTQPALAILVLTVVAYLPVTQAGYVWDDDVHVTHNQTLRDGEGLRRIWLEPGVNHQYYPLTFTTFWVEARVWGTGERGAVGYHLVNVLLHALAAILVWLILERLGLPGAWWVGLLFALHPVHVESVAWISERKNTLSAVLYLGAMLAYLRFTPPDEETDLRARDWKPYGLALVLFQGALLAKTVTATLPAALLLILWWRRGSLSRREVLCTLPMFALGVGLASLTVVLEQQAGARGAEFQLSWVERCLLAGRVPWFYLQTLVAPFGLCFSYPRWTVDAGAAWQYLFPAATVALLVGLWVQRERIGRGPLAAVLFFGGTLVPVLGFFSVYPFRFSFVADHFQYLASLGILALGVGLGAHLSADRRRAGIAAGALAAALFLGLTFARATVFQTYEGLLRDTLAKNPAAWKAHANLGILLATRGDHAEALASFEAAVGHKPDDPVLAQNLAQACARSGQSERADAEFLRAIALDPRWALGHARFADHLLATRRYDRAARRYREAIARGAKGKHEALWRTRLGVALWRGGRPREAEAELRRAIALDPSRPEPKAHLQRMLMER